MARFTNVNPIRDGRNWYIYVGGDPVIRVDLWGLSADDIQSGAQVPMIWPAAGTPTSEFGPRRPILTDQGFTSSFHTGIDIANEEGTPIVAAARGVVLDIGYVAEGYGYYVIVGHERTGWSGLTTRYAHLEAAPAVPVGAVVEQGDLLGSMGSTGKSEGSHLHFETRVNNEAVSPREYLP